MQNLLKPKAIFLDWDGTIVDSMPNIFKAFSKTQEIYSKPVLSVSELNHIVRLGAEPEVIFKDELGYEDAHIAEASAFFKGHVKELRSKAINLMGNIEGFLSAAHSNDIPLGVVSNMNHPDLCHEIETLGWNKYFNAVAGGGKAERNKPHPDPIYLVASEMGIERAELADTWFVGDMDADRQAAEAAGCKFVFYSIGEKKLACHAEVRDYADLKRHLVQTCEMS